MVKTNPTQRSLKLLRDEGATVQIVERWNQWAKVRQDLFGFIDILALKDGKCIGIQTTSGSNMAHRRDKAFASPNLKKWLDSGCVFELHGWRKVKVQRGMKAMRWECNRETYTEYYQIQNLILPTK